MSDNCLSAANADQADADLDLRGDACDCAPADPLDSRPGEVARLRVLGDREMLSWDVAAGATGYDVFRESEGAGRAGSAADATCLAPALTATTWADAVRPGVGRCFRYLVRAVNACGAGPWGAASDGIARAASACP